MKYLNRLMSRLRVMSTDYENLHSIVEESERTSEHKKQLHTQLREAKNDPEELKRLSFLIHGNDTARQQAEAITEGESEPKHLGKHTPETLTQEIVSLGNINPMFRNSKWLKRAHDIKSTIQEQMKDDPRQYQGLLSKINSVIQGEL